jgi:hypothetical protein
MDSGAGLEPQTEVAAGRVPAGEVLPIRSFRRGLQLQVILARCVSALATGSRRNAFGASARIPMSWSASNGRRCGLFSCRTAIFFPHGVDPTTPGTLRHKPAMRSSRFSGVSCATTPSGSLKCQTTSPPFCCAERLSVIRGNAIRHPHRKRGAILFVDNKVSSCADPEVAY